MTTVLYSYQPFSNSGKELSRGLRIKRIKHVDSRFRARPRDTVINWGSSELPERLSGAGRILNPPHGVRRASNKLLFFQRMADNNVPTVEWTTIKEIAQAWVGEGHTVFARHTLTGHSGQGIEVLDPEQIEQDMEDMYDNEFPDAPLYTKYFKKKNEYRVHVAFGEVIDVQKKARRRETPDDQVNWLVRNLDGGFIYARNDVELPLVVQDAVNLAHDAMELDFGAYDVIYNEHHNRAAVLEVNTAPGLQGTTIDNYVEAFRRNL
jgi:glutathione synthase/RimK-type ligase-like ATP-grasp enzyme